MGPFLPYFLPSSPILTTVVKSYLNMLTFILWLILWLSLEHFLSHSFILRSFPRLSYSNSRLVLEMSKLNIGRRKSSKSIRTSNNNENSMKYIGKYHVKNILSSSIGLLEFMLSADSKTKRSQAKDWLSRGQVLVNKNPQSHFNFQLTSGDEVMILSVGVTNKNDKNNKGLNLPKTEKLEIVHEDESLIIVDKCYGISCLPKKNDERSSVGNVANGNKLRSNSVFEFVSSSLSKKRSKALDKAPKVCVMNHVDTNASGLGNYIYL